MGLTLCPGRASAQMVQGPGAPIDPAYTPNCAAIIRSWPRAISEDLIVDGLVCSEGVARWPAVVARSYMRACSAELNEWITLYSANARPPELGGVVDYEANDSIRNTFQNLQNMTSRADVERYVQERLRYKGATQNCFARYRVQQIEGAASRPSAPSSAPRPTTAVPAAPAVPSPLRPRQPEGPATAAALDDILEGAVPPAGVPAAPSQPRRPRPVPPTLDVLTNSGTRCMSLTIENFRVDANGNASQDWVLTNKCQTTQLVVAEVSRDSSPFAFEPPGIVASGTHPLWNRKDVPANLGFKPELWNSWNFIMGPGETRRGDDIGHPGERYVAWLASCDAYRDGYFEMMFRAAVYLGVDARVACVHNTLGAPR